MDLLSVPMKARVLRLANRVPFSGFWICAATVLVASAISSLVMRGHLQDDAFIELRYAHRLLASGRLEFNVGQPSFGTSSPLYVYILAGLGRFLPIAFWPAMAKAISSAGLLLAICLALWLVLTSPLIRDASPKWKALAVLVVASMLAVPSADRWLEDGMETSLGLASALACGVVIARWHRDPATPSLGDVAISGLLLAAPGLLRPDLLPISVAGIALVALTSRRPRRIQVGLFGIGVVIAWTLWIYARQGAVLSDAAIAKETGQVTLRWPLDFLRAMGVVSPAWLIVPFLGAVLLLFSNDVRGRRGLLIPVLAAFPIVFTILVGTVEGQYIHGARYFLADLGFMFAVVLVFAVPPTSQGMSSALYQGLGILLALSVAHVAVSWAPDVRLGGAGWGHIERGQFAKEEVVGAQDIGEFGWFVPIRMFDLSGLVNGRQVAQSRRHGSDICPTVKVMGFPEAFVLTPVQSSFLKDNAGSLSCQMVNARYRNTHATIMEMRTTSSRSVYELWLRTS